MDQLTALPPEHITRIVDFLIEDIGDVTEQKANARALRLVCRKISQCSRNAMLTTYFRHIRLLYTYPAVHSLIEFTHFPDVVAKIESITIALVSPKYRECPPPSFHEQLRSVAEQVESAKVNRWVYSDSAARASYTREYEGALLTALDKALLGLKASRTHVDLRITFCYVEGDFGGKNDKGRSAAILKTYIGGPRLESLSEYYRDNGTQLSIDFTRSSNPTHAVNFLLCALARTGYSPASLDLDYSDYGGRTPSLEGAFMLPTSLKHPALARLTTLKLHLDHADFYDFGFSHFRFGGGVVEIGKWLAVMPDLEFLSLRFEHDPKEYEVDLSEEYTVNVTPLIHGLRHTKLRSLVLDRWRVASAPLARILKLQASLALIRCELEETSSAWPALFVRMARELTLSDFLFFDSREPSTPPDLLENSVENTVNDDNTAYESAALDPVSWWRTGTEAVKNSLEDAGHGILLACDCADKITSVCCRWPCAMGRDVAEWVDHEPIA
ncbi:hypothetical protein LTR95_006585 [Oleoguttula sp. CCFEE 5521]